MVIDSAVAAYLRRYFNLACMHYKERNWGLSTFFAILLIEECAKILCLRDANLADDEQRNAILSHSDKHWMALVNLLDGSERFDTLPKRWQELAWSWFSEMRASFLRNRSLYLWFNKYSKSLTVPDEATTPDEAGILVYLSGFAAVELAEYVEIDAEWVSEMSNGAEAFRAEYLGA